MSLFDDDRPKKPSKHEIGSDLSLLSVEELDERVALLHAEIERLKTARATKETGLKAAENLFRK
jgi:uncharacterized small protein (DUF1192 family)